MIFFNTCEFYVIKERPKRLQIRDKKFASRSFFEKKRPKVFKPGPYKDRNGNLRFIGRDK